MRHAEDQIKIRGEVIRVKNRQQPLEQMRAPVESTVQNSARKLLRGDVVFRAKTLCKRRGSHAGGLTLWLQGGSGLYEPCNITRITLI